MPIFCSEAGQLQGGGMATIGINYYDLGYQTAAMAVEVLNGADISKMPIQAQTTFEYAINKTACQEIGLRSRRICCPCRGDDGRVMPPMPPQGGMALRRGAASGLYYSCIPRFRWDMCRI